MSQPGLQAIRGAFVHFVDIANEKQPITEQFRYLPDGLLLTDNGKVCSLTAWSDDAQIPANAVFTDLRGKLIMPGFIDTHIHYPQTEMIAAYGEQLLEWLQQYTFPVESQYGDPGYAAEMAKFFIHQLFSHGTTTALVFASVHPESVDALFAEAE